MLAYKFTAAGGVGRFTGFQWPVPAAGAPGAWVEAGAAGACELGVHACRAKDLPHWLAAELWEVELAGDVVEATHKVVATRGRLLRRVPGWPDAAPAFARDCAARARDLAVSALAGAGLGDLARATGTAATAADLAAVATAAADLAPPLVATLCGFASDCAMDIDDGYYAMCAYVAATAFAGWSTGSVRQDMGAPGWAEERARQARWLVDRLGLRSDL